MFLLTLEATLILASVHFIHATQVFMFIVVVVTLFKATSFGCPLSHAPFHFTAILAIEYHFHKFVLIGFRRLFFFPLLAREFHQLIYLLVFLATLFFI